MDMSEAGKLGAKASIATRQRLLILKIEAYDLSPKLCKQCSKPLSYQDSQKKKVFCNSSCSASFTNSNRKGAIESVEHTCENCLMSFFQEGCTTLQIL